MPDCPHCAKHYDRNSAHYREHVLKCPMRDKKRILDGIADIPTTKQPQPSAPEPIVETITESTKQSKRLPIPGNISAGGKMVFKGMYVGSVFTQRHFNGMMKGFDTKIYEKRREYAEMIDEMLEKRGMLLDVPVEVRFASELSMDAFRSFKDRIDNPLDLSTIPHKTKIKNTPTKKQTYDIDRMFADL